MSTMDVNKTGKTEEDYEMSEEMKLDQELDSTEVAPEETFGSFLGKTRGRALELVKRTVENLGPVVKKVADTVGPKVTDYVREYANDLAPILIKGGKTVVTGTVKEGVKFASNPEEYVERKKTAFGVGIDTTTQRTEAALETAIGTVSERVEQERTKAEDAGVVQYGLTRLIQGADVVYKATSIAGRIGKALLGEVATHKVARPNDLVIGGIDVLIGQYTDEKKGQMISIGKAAAISTFVTGISQDSEFNAIFNEEQVNVGYNILRLYTGLATSKTGPILEFIQKGGTFPGKIEKPEMLEKITASLQQYSKMLSGKESELLQGSRR